MAARPRPTTEALTTRQALGFASDRLAGCEQGEPHRLARLLLARFTGVSVEAQLAHPEQELPTEAAEAFAHAVEQVASGTPLPYLTGTREFYGLQFEVSPAVLIPRPETELLVEASLKALAAGPEGPVLDVGTGSGIIAVCLARALPKRALFATDLSSTALEVARRNAARNGVADRIRFLQADLLEGFPAQPTFAAIVSNPPYVEPEEVASLPAHVRDHEPLLALAPEGPVEEFLSRLFGQAAERLLPGAVLALELGLGQEGLYRRLAESLGLEVETVLADLAGIPRALVAIRR